VIKLYLDEDVHKKIAISLRIHGYDVISAHEVQNWGLSDFQQIEYSISQSRAIFTFNSGDFMRLHKEYIQKGKSHFGILLSKQTSLSESIRRLTIFLSKHTAEEIKSNIFWI